MTTCEVSKKRRLCVWEEKELGGGGGGGCFMLCYHTGMAAVQTDPPFICINKPGLDLMVWREGDYHGPLLQ